MLERRGDEAAYILYFLNALYKEARSERPIVYFVAAV